MDEILGMAVGIDPGTTSPCVGVWKNDGVEITAEGTASADTERFIDDAAVNQSARNPAGTVVDAKRSTDPKFADPIEQPNVELETPARAPGQVLKLPPCSRAQARAGDWMSPT